MENKSILGLIFQLIYYKNAILIMIVRGWGFIFFYNIIRRMVKPAFLMHQ